MVAPFSQPDQEAPQFQCIGSALDGQYFERYYPRTRLSFGFSLSLRLRQGNP